MNLELIMYLFLFPNKSTGASLCGDYGLLMVKAKVSWEFRDTVLFARVTRELLNQCVNSDYTR